MVESRFVPMQRKAAVRFFVRVLLADRTVLAERTGFSKRPRSVKVFASYMPIYEFGCPDCRRIFSFLSKRVKPKDSPACPRCGKKKLARQVSSFAMLSGGSKPKESAENSEGAGPDMDDPRVMRAMSELERDMEHLDENNPRHMAHMMKKMKDLMPPGTMPKEMDVAIKRLEAGEDPEKIEAEMGDIFGDFMGGDGDEEGGGSGGAGGYTRDPGLYDY